MQNRLLTLICNLENHVPLTKLPQNLGKFMSWGRPVINVTRDKGNDTNISKINKLIRITLSHRYVCFSTSLSTLDELKP